MTSSPERKLRHSRTSKVLVLISGSVLFLFLVISLFLDREIDIRVDQNIESPPEHILPAIADLKNWMEWSVWDQEYYHKAGSIPTYETNAVGEAVKSVERQVMDNQVQVIIMERKTMTSKEVTFEYNFWGGEENSGSPLLNAHTTFTLNPVEGGTHIIWQYQADYSPVMGINPLQKYFLLFTEITLKRAYRESLSQLQVMLEK